MDVTLLLLLTVMQGLNTWWSWSLYREKRTWFRLLNFGLGSLAEALFITALIMKLL